MISKWLSNNFNHWQYNDSIFENTNNNRLEIKTIFSMNMESTVILFLHCLTLTSGNDLSIPNL